MDTKEKPEQVAVEVEYTDNAAPETVLVKCLSNVDWVKWIDMRFDSVFLVFRSVERRDPEDRADQTWFDRLTRASARKVTETACELNGKDEETKKVLAATIRALESFATSMPSSTSSPAATTPAS